MATTICGAVGYVLRGEGYGGPGRGGRLAGRRMVSREPAGPAQEQNSALGGCVAIGSRPRSILSAWPYLRRFQPRS